MAHDDARSGRAAGPDRVDRQFVADAPGRLVVLLLGDQLPPALQPDLSRALVILCAVREQEIRDRTKTIMRLRATWAGVNPVDEAAAKDLRWQRSRESPHF